MEGDLLQLQLLLVAQGRWHHHPLIRNRRLSQKSDSCWQPTVLSICCCSSIRLFVSLFRSFVYIARTILHSSSAISCDILCARTILHVLVWYINRTSTFDILHAHKILHDIYLVRTHDIAHACLVLRINRTNTCDILHDIYLVRTHNTHVLVRYCGSTEQARAISCMRTRYCTIFIMRAMCLVDL
jgi:hypothetical protein